MELNQDGLAVICVTEQAVIKGRIRHRSEEGATDDSPAGHSSRPAGLDFANLLDVTILDHDHRIVRKVSRLSLNKNFVVYFMEDEMASHLDRVKSMIGAEDYESAVGELERLLSIDGGDADVLYLAGVVNQRVGNEKRSRDYLARALGLTLDEKLRCVIKRHLERD